MRITLEHFEEMLQRDEESRKETMRSIWGDVVKMQRHEKGNLGRTMTDTEVRDVEATQRHEKGAREHLRINSIIEDAEDLRPGQVTAGGLSEQSLGKMPASVVPAAQNVQATAPLPQQLTFHVQNPDQQTGVNDETTKPPYSFANLVKKAILSSPTKRMTCHQIYHWIRISFAYHKKSGDKLKVKVTNALSSNKGIFVIVPNTVGMAQGPKGGRGSYWTVKPDHAAILVDPLDRARYDLYLRNGTTN